VFNIFLLKLSGILVVVLDQAVDKICLPVKLWKCHMDVNILLFLHFKEYGHSLFERMADINIWFS
jgi:hypothetical protein